MAKNMKLNIRLFDEEGALDPSAYNTLVQNYDADIPKVNQVFVENADALEVLRQVAGSPRISQNLQQAINGANQSIDATADYFDSVRKWGEGVVSAVQGILGVGLSSMGAALDRTVLNQINENFAGGMVGIKNFSDVDTYINKITGSVLPTLSQSLSTLTSDVQGANNSLPSEVHSALGTTISTNNDDVLSGYTRLSEAINQNLEQVKGELSSAISDLAAGARGGN